MPPRTGAPLLSMSGIVKSFPGVRALRAVDLSLPAGHVLGVVGENGAGKSTLMKVLAGAYEADAGEITVDGAALGHGPAAALDAGIAVIYQELSLVPDLTVAENLFLGRMPTRFGMLDRRTARARAREALARVGLGDLHPDTRVGTLGLGTRQLIEITKALVRNARILVMDEPTAALQRGDIANLFEVVRALRADGMGVIYISHHLEEIFELCDAALVLRDGEAVDERPIADWTEDGLVRAMVARDLDELYPWRPREAGEVVLEATGLARPPRLRDGELTVRAGEIVGVAGIDGAGRTELLKAVCGAEPAVSGEVLLRGRPLRLRSPADGIREGIVYLAEDRKLEGLVLGAGVDENVALSSLGRLSTAGWLNPGPLRELGREAISTFGIKAPGPRTQTGLLSGGNQQKVVLARVARLEPAVILLDEPTRGIDVGARAEIYRYVLGMAERGAAVVLVSSELPELLGMSDRVVVMRQGRMVAWLSRAQADQETVLRWATAGTSPREGRS